MKIKMKMKMKMRRSENSVRKAMRKI